MIAKWMWTKPRYGLERLSAELKIGGKELVKKEAKREVLARGKDRNKIGKGKNWKDKELEGA